VCVEWVFGVFICLMCVCVIRTVHKGFMLLVSGTRGLQVVTPLGKRRVAKCDLEIRSELKRILYKCCYICEGCICVTQNVDVWRSVVSTAYLIGFIKCRVIIG
jgi:hypothetical protein